MKIFSNPFILGALLLTIVSSVLYFSTVPNVNTGYADSDELITVAKIHGVAHPPGYPLYTMLLTAMTALPLPLSFAGKANALNTVLHILTILNMYIICILVTRKVLPALIGALFLTVSFSFWFHGLFAEVFALNNLLISYIVLFLFIARITPKLQNKYVRFAAGAFGLALANQQAILLLIPMFAWIFLTIDRKIVYNWKLLATGLIVFICAYMIPYLYLPLAASGSPVINWENPQTIQGIIRSITRAGYAEALGGAAYVNFKGITVSQRLLGLRLFVLFLIDNLHWLPFSMGVIGIGYLFLKKRYRSLIIIILGILGGGLFFAVYSPPSLSLYTLYELGIHQRFYLASFLFIAIAIAFGTTALEEIAKRYTQKYSYIVYAVAALIAVYVGVNHYMEIKVNNFSVGDKYGRALLQSLDRNALLICYTEPSCFTAVYLQQQYNLRTDVIIIPADLAQQPFEQLKKKYPKIITTSAQRTNAKRAVALIKEIIRSNIEKRAIYVAGINHSPTYLTMFGLNANPFYLLPQGCAMKVSQKISMIKQTAACKSVEEEILRSKFTDKAAISRMFPIYAGYQRYFNYQQYVAFGCYSLARTEYERGLLFNPLIAFAGTKTPNELPKKDTCGKQTK